MRELPFRLLDRLYMGLSRPFGRELRARALLDWRAAQSPARVEPPEGTLLVLAPHPDDESIGCGGLILLKPDRAERVRIVLMTGGEQGRPDWTETATARTRREEMEACRRLLGVAQVHSLPGEDQRLSSQPELAAPLRELLDGLLPDAVLLPFFMDAHPDHIATNRIFLEAAHDVLPEGLPVWGYEVWSHCPANVAVDISAVIDQKRAAIAVHASQDRRMNYAEAIAGLNRYRAMQINWRGESDLTHAEAYVRMALREYRRAAEAWFSRTGVPAEPAKSEGAP
ncbi:MAG TPA: PIG-L family deacetylase [Candidatus Sumerlaeota bacterium]|nr:PIG-L family deacetylase [Candidatus Sumerlaeota bacterium]